MKAATDLAKASPPSSKRRSSRMNTASYVLKGCLLSSFVVAFRCRRQFARPIRKQNAGIYWNFIVEVPPAKVGDFKEKYRLNESIFRLAVFGAEELLASRKRKPAQLPMQM